MCNGKRGVELAGGGTTDVEGNGTLGVLEQ